MVETHSALAQEAETLRQDATTGLVPPTRRSRERTCFGVSSSAGLAGRCNTPILLHQVNNWIGLRAQQTQPGLIFTDIFITAMK